MPFYKPFSEIDVSRHIVCENCAEEVTGGYDTSKNQIIVCQNRVYTEEMTQAVIGHELIHMFDYCRAKMEFTNLEHIACSEVGCQLWNSLNSKMFQ